ncbi:MAG: CAP domain-containing protein [Chloroflexota bacterium]
MFRRIGLSLLFILSACALASCNVVQSFLPSRTSEQPDPYVTYVVKPGDTTSQIALRYHITIEQLIALNAEQYPTLARDPSSLKPGWRLRVPGLWSSEAARAPTSAEPQADLNAASKLVIEEINNARAQSGLQLLKSDLALTRIANDRSADMIARNYFSHYDPQTAQEPLLRYLQAAKFAYRYAGENIAEIKNDAGWVPVWLTIAARYTTRDLASEFVKGWLNSPEHRANIYGANYRRTGVALAVSGDGRRIVATQTFAD